MKSSFTILILFSVIIFAIASHSHSKSKLHSKLHSKTKVHASHLNHFARGLGEAIIGIQNNHNSTSCIPAVWNITRSEVEPVRGEIEDEFMGQFDHILRDVLLLNKIMLSREQDHYSFCTHSKRAYLSSWLSKTLQDESKVNFIEKSQTVIEKIHAKPALRSNITRRTGLKALGENFKAWEQFPIVDALTTLSHLRVHLSEFLGSDLALELKGYVECVAGKIAKSEIGNALKRFLINVNRFTANMKSFMEEILNCMCHRHYFLDFTRHLVRAFREKDDETKWLLLGKSVGQFIISIGAARLLI